MVCETVKADINELIELNESLLKEDPHDEALKFNLEYLKGFKEEIVSGRL